MLHEMPPRGTAPALLWVLLCGPGRDSTSSLALLCPWRPSLALSNQTSSGEAPAAWVPGLITIVFGAVPWGLWPRSGLLPSPLPGDLAAA